MFLLRSIYKTLICSLEFLELFQPNSQSAIKSLTNLVSWICKFGSAIAFPNLQLAWNEYVYIPFLVVSVTLAIIFLIFFPETKGRNLSNNIIFNSQDCQLKTDTADEQKNQRENVI